MKEEKFLGYLHEFGQERLAEYFNGLDDEHREEMLEQADRIDFACLEFIHAKENEKPRGVISPIKTMKLDEISEKKDSFRNIGLEAIRAGKIGALCLGGGMGTRLGSEHAKGMYDIGVTKPVYIYQRMFENMLEVVKEAGAFFHIFIMTSYINHDETVEFLKEHDYFGYNPDFVSFFKQDMAPCLDEDGDILLEAPGRMAMSPNGNGGFYSSLVNCGLDKKAKENGIEYINVFAIDNVLQKIADPVFAGAVIDSGRASGAKVVVKAEPKEKVGAICLEDGAPSVVEYYEMTDELLNAKNEEGEAAYNYGVILNYLFKLDVMDKFVKAKLPFHVVKKKVPYIEFDENAEGGFRLVKPETPNGYKLETLTLDMVHLMETCLPFEVVREQEFAPIKNPTGVDSVESARVLLELNGITL